MMANELVLPTVVRKAVARNPRTLLIYSLPKAGKTTIVSQLKNSLILECELGGADFVEGSILDIDSPGTLTRAFEAIEAKGNPYKYVVIDTLTKLDEWSEIVGTYNYMDKSQGKRFNREDGIPDGKKILHTDKRFETVHELPQGFGYQYSRMQMLLWYERIIQLAPHVILLAHVRDKYIESVKTGEVVESIEIGLTGKIKAIIAARVDAVAYLFRKENQTILNFNNENNIICGGRCPHLTGEIIISEKQKDGKIATFWDKVYI